MYVYNNIIYPFNLLQITFINEVNTISVKCKD